MKTTKTKTKIENNKITKTTLSVNSKARLALFPDFTQLSVTCSFCSHVGRAWEQRLKQDVGKANLSYYNKRLTHNNFHCPLVYKSYGILRSIS